MKLSILIRTLPERAEKFEKLILELDRQRQELGMQDSIQILYDDTPKGIITAGEKANILKSKATGHRIVFHDDDDFPSPNYLRLLMQFNDHYADIITFDMNYYVNDEYKRKIVITLFGGEAYTEKVQLIDRVYFHICSVKREIANKVKFPDIQFMEDEAYSCMIKPLLETEYHIGDTIYNYYFDEKLTETRVKK